MDKILKDGYLNLDITEFPNIIDDLQYVYDNIDSIKSMNLVYNFNSEANDDEFKSLENNIISKEYFNLKDINISDWFESKGINNRFVATNIEIHDLTKTDSLINTFDKFTKVGMNQTFLELQLPAEPPSVELDNLYNRSNKILDTIYKKVYGDRYFKTNRVNITNFKKNALIQPHQDGYSSDRICGILVYLNKDWNPIDGGSLIIENDTEIPPTYGNIIVLDYTENNLVHSVSNVTHDRGRWAILKFYSSEH